MASRSFRVFGTRKDLESVFYEFQELNLVKYYKCGRNENKIDDITKTIYFGISLNGSHIGNQYLVIKDDKSICFKVEFWGNTQKYIIIHRCNNFQLLYASGYEAEIFEFMVKKLNCVPQKEVKEI